MLPKAVKNAVEIDGHRAAQARDGAAVTRFLHWLSIEGPKGTVTEISAAEKLHQFRREAGDLRDLSFDTISGAGPNGAIVHYRVSEATNRRLEPNSASIWSIRADNIPTVRPTSPARCGLAPASRRPKSRTASAACCAAI